MNNRFKPADIDKALEKVKFPPSTGSAVWCVESSVDLGIFEWTVCQGPMKGVSAGLCARVCINCCCMGYISDCGEAAIQEDSFIRKTSSGL